MRERLTTRDLDTLANAVDMRKRFDAGIFPRDVGDRSHFRRLERLGLIEFDAWGRDIDRSIEQDVRIFKLTAAGIKALADYDWNDERSAYYKKKKAASNG